MNRRLRKAVTGILASSALALVSTHASAALVSFDAGTAGTSATVTDDVSLNSWTFGFGVNLGWNHTINVHDLHVTGGAGDIVLTAKQTVATDALPGFTIWHRTGGSGFIGGSHQFDQVTGPTGTNAFMAASIDSIVGYGNAGAAFTNANGNAVGHGGVFVPGSWTSGTDGSGLGYVTLNLTGLAAGDYYILNGGSDFNNTSGKTTGGFQLTATVVPVPAAVWLFGSALTGLVGWSRRKTAA
jgi:hypothetical protein